MRPYAELTAVIADPYPLWRDALAALLEGLVTVVGEAMDAEEGAAMVEKHQPDVIVTDYTLATATGPTCFTRRDSRARSPAASC
jgi:DNA-binding NarL/FixJ family response regulator